MVFFVWRHRHLKMQWFDFNYLVAGHHQRIYFFVCQHLLFGDLTRLCWSQSQFLVLPWIFLAIVVCKIWQFEAKASPKLGKEGRRVYFILFVTLAGGSEQLSLRFEPFLKSAGARQIAFWLPSPDWAITCDSCGNSGARDSSRSAKANCWNYLTWLWFKPALFFLAPLVT